MNKPAILGGVPRFEHFLDIVKPILPGWDALRPDIYAAYTSGRLTNFGPYCTKLEEQLCERLGCKYAVAVSNATAGLYLALASLELSKKQVLVPSFTWASPVDAVLANGMIPKFVDIDPATWNMRPESIESAIREQTAAIMPVHIFGNPCQTVIINSIAEKHGLKVVYDAAHALGAEVEDKAVGANCECEVFSLSTTKLLPAGEGGVIVTNDEPLAERLRFARNYGYGKGLDWKLAGCNGKMTEFSAIIALHGLPSLTNAIHRRNEYAAAYRESLKDIPGISFQAVTHGNLCTYKDFGILINEPEFGISRDLLALALSKENIDTRPYFSPPIHQTSLGREYLTESDDLSNTECTSKQVLCLPIYSDMQETHIAGTGEAIRSIHKYANAISKISSVGQ
jgi:dTDP-4-amino-4,6-dideoxygalactose transaminase